MRLFRVKRTDNISWCEDIEYLVLAKDEMWAEKLARLHSTDFQNAPIEVAEIDTTQEGVLLTTNKGG